MRCEAYLMDADRQIEETIRAILAKDAGAVDKYRSLSDDARRKVLETLSNNRLRSLTRLIKDAKKKSFKAANKRFLGIASGTVDSHRLGKSTLASTASERGRLYKALPVEGATQAPVIETPVYLLDETLMEENMRILQYVKDRTGCKVLHALKSYASFATFPMMSRYLDGTCASGLLEARLGYEEFKKEVHTFGAAYREKEIRQILKYSDSIIFNSFYQLHKYGKMARKSNVEIGLRVNPGHAEVAADMYNPCAPY